MIKVATNTKKDIVLVACGLRDRNPQSNSAN